MAQTIQINKVAFGTEVIDTHVYKVTYIDSTGVETMTQPAFVSAGQIRTGKAVVVVNDPDVREATLTCQTGKCFAKTYPVTWGSLSCDFTILLDEPSPTSTPLPTATEVPPTPTPSPTQVPPTPTATEVPPTPTPGPTSTPLPTATPTPTSTPTPTPGPTSTPLPTATEVPPTPTPGPTSTPTPTPTGTPPPNCDFTGKITVS